jgi:hypothetical protein
MLIAALLAALSFSQTPAQAATGRLVGRVTAEGANTPVAGARVMLLPAGRPIVPMTMPQPTVTDQDGRFVFDRITAGSYRIEVQKTGFAPLNDLGFGQSTPVTEVAAGQVIEVQLRLQKGGVIAGKVLDASGEPLADLRVMAMRRMNDPRMNAPAGMSLRLFPAPAQGPQQTNDIGEFRITGLAPGDYIVAAVPQLGSPFGGPGVAPSSTGSAIISTYYPGTIDQAAAHTVTVRAGETTSNVTFSIQSVPAFRVSGRVVDENGAPAAGAMVMLMADPRSGAFMGPMGHARTGDDGRFTIADVPSGTYRIHASIPVMMGAGGGGAGVVGGVVGGSVTSWSTSIVGAAGGRGAAEQPAEVTVNGVNVTGLRLVARRPAPQ